MRLIHFWYVLFLFVAFYYYYLLVLKWNIHFVLIHILCIIVTIIVYLILISICSNRRFRFYSFWFFATLFMWQIVMLLFFICRLNVQYEFPFHNPYTTFHVQYSIELHSVLWNVIPNLSLRYCKVEIIRRVNLILISNLGQRDTGEGTVKTTENSPNKLVNGRQNVFEIPWKW